MIKIALQQVNATIDKYCQLAGRERDSVALVAVSKRHSCDKIRTAYACGQRAFGENYLSEALEKQAQLDDFSIEWHFIGQIQSNKTRKIAEHFAWVHTVSSYKVAKRLSDQRPDALPKLNICLQINIDGEASKNGLAPDCQAVTALAKEIDALPKLRLRGLMCIPAPKADKAAEMATFTAMQQLQHALNDKGLALDTLSMGMSADLETAIACGATMVRVGTAIFGARD